MARLALQFGLGSAIVAGIIAALVFAAFEMIATAALMGPQAFFMPLRMIGAIALGAAALDPTYPLITAAAAGVLVHVALSVAFAILFAAIAPRTATTGTLIALGMVFGTALWLVNFYLIAPAAGWSWFPEQADPVVQFLAHAFFFGAPLAWFLARSRTIAAQPTL